MDPRRFLSSSRSATLGLALGLTLSSCAIPGAQRVAPAPAPALVSLSTTPAPSIASMAGAAPSSPAAISAPLSAAPDPEPTPSRGPDPVSSTTARPYLEEPGAGHDRPPSSVTGRPAIVAANRAALTPSEADAFTGGVQVFGWREGRVYQIWTAPLRVTTLTLSPGETVTAKAAGDTVRWQIGESRSGEDAQARTHVLIKPLQRGLETNLVLTTNQRVYLLSLRSGDVEAFNVAVSWEGGPTPSPVAVAEASPASLPPVDVSAAVPQGALDARYRITARGRPPAWTPTAVFNDGTRTFITLAPETEMDEAPALFIRADGGEQLVNYRQSDGLLIVDRVFQEAELRLGDRRPAVVRIQRLAGAPR